MNRLLHIYDLHGNLILSDAHAFDSCNNSIKLSNKQMSRIIKVVQDPALIMESGSGTLIKRYYFRSVNWDQTLLIGVNYVYGVWQIQNYLENPTGAFVLKLLKKNIVEGTLISPSNEILQIIFQR